MNDTPCKTCIVLPACKARLSQLHIYESNVYSIISRLADKCPALTEYMQQHSFYSYNLTHRYKAVLFLTGISLADKNKIVLYPAVTDMEVNK